MFGSFESFLLRQVQSYLQDHTERAYGRAFIVAQMRIRGVISSKSDLEIPLVMQGCSGVQRCAGLDDEEYHFWQ